MKIKQHPAVADTLASYPHEVKQRLLFLRGLILQTAAEIKSIIEIEETLKWGEPAYLTANGSTIRIGWKQNRPDEYAMFFHCKTKLLDVFKVLYKDEFTFDGNRAFIFTMNDTVPVAALKHCIELSLTYHLRKNLPMLGA